jgi:hypothetical protein
MRPFNPEDINKRLIKLGFIMIEKKKDMESLKGFINSLWKWKMSNIQATYYAKFIKVFKESEEMIKFSNILTKKHCEYVHCGFRAILAVGHSRTNRKREIVEKYLSKKMRNYFLAFRHATSHTEINVWKSKYTGTIKAKILYDILSTLLLKSKFMGMEKMKGYYNYTANIDLFQEKYEKFRQLQTEHAFEKIKWSGQAKLFGILERLADKSLKAVLKDNFEHLNNRKRLSKLDDLIGRTVCKNLLYAGFSKINKRKERVIKGKLSIILLATLITQRRNTEKKQVIQCFTRNKSKRLGA